MNFTAQADIRPSNSFSAARLTTGAFAIGLLTISVAFAIYRLLPPAVNLSTAPSTEFSSARAVVHLAVIARKPHPIGSAEHGVVRDYILHELTVLGLNPQLQTTSRVSNILVRLPGTGGSKALMLAGHYDTVPDSSGASDDGSAVAVMLETLRALKAAGAPLRNDLICLFSDGEEAGLEGAKAFAYSHPWAKDVGLVLNFEARGNRGPAVMFETSEENGWLIEQLSNADPHAVANSLADEIYRQLPNKTDLTIFKEAGMAGLNFAYFDGFNHYHSSLDTLDALDERSLQQQGSYAWTLTHHFGNSDLGAIRRPNEIYFNLLGRTLVHYSAKWVVPLAAMAVVLFGGAILLGRRRRQLTWIGIGRGFAATLLTVVATIVFVAVAWWLSGPLLGRKIARGAVDYKSGLDMLILTACALLAATLGYVWFASRIGGWHVLAGGLMWWLLFTVLTSVLLPGGSFLFVWPFFFGLLALTSGLVVRHQKPVSTRSLAVLAVCVIPGALIVAPIIYLTLITLTLRSVSSVPVFAAPLALLLVLLAPQLQGPIAANAQSST